ncbi:hypothetical protein RchiOBHm_Chr1g0360651 [Rosa chinensis]|uniref:Uncharacterized protein n=1 Tax=Rosa chinensis TaxID=74649 RepID=A0A2P6SIP1_ROSCH|nr:hypothetical protein RchiOBHm_Chr1g0360651 [Rosa chinensis]
MSPIMYVAIANNCSSVGMVLNCLMSGTSFKLGLGVICNCFMYMFSFKSGLRVDFEYFWVMVFECSNLGF